VRWRERHYCRFAVVLSAAVCILSSLHGDLPTTATVDRYSTDPIRVYIVQSADAAAAEAIVVDVGGRVLDRLEIIDAVGAELTDEQATALRRRTGIVSVYADRIVRLSGAVPETHFPQLVGAASAHPFGVTGANVTVAVLDTGIWEAPGLDRTPGGVSRILAQYDALLDVSGPVALSGGDATSDDDYWDDDWDDDDGDDDGDDDDSDYDGGPQSQSVDGIEDWSGHGTHVTSIIAGSRATSAGRFQGVAPGASIVAVKAFEPDGSGRYIDVIRGLDWILANRDRYAIRVLNLSFSGDALSRYWEDPLNQAVMAAWQAGIVVVAAAGNSGPDPMTVGVPGNVPYVITVGAMTDSFTPANPNDDLMATWSSAGPTFDGFVKPDLVAPGGHMIGLMSPDSWIALEHPEFYDPDGNYFVMSGTSQSTAVVSGVVALLLQVRPWLTPDQVKCRLTATARPAIKRRRAIAYSVFQQGAGMVDARRAMFSGASGCANRGMDVGLDLLGVQHYGGPARQDADGEFYLVEPDDPFGRLPGDGFSWSGDELWQDGALWRRGGLWRRGELSTETTAWNRGEPWLEGFTWQEADLFTDGGLWRRGLMGSVGINRWVEQE